MRLIPLAVLLAYPLIAREPLAKRIVHTDPTKYSREAHVHEGAGEMQFEELFDTSAFDTNLLFLHRALSSPRSFFTAAYCRPRPASDITITTRWRRCS